MERNNDSTIVFAGERLTDVESDADTDTENIFAREHILKTPFSRLRDYLITKPWNLVNSMERMKFVDSNNIKTLPLYLPFLSVGIMIISY